MEWPSLNQAVLIGKVAAVTRIQWADGSSTALVRLSTKKRIATPEGWRTGYDRHECEISPGERFFAVAWEGAVVMVRGTYGSFEWKPRDSQKAFDRHVLEAQGFQVVLPSEKEHTPPKTVFREYRRETAKVVETHTHDAAQDEGIPNG